MPNLSNVTSPITFFGFGRSGTSLIFDIFLRHPEVFAVGETAPLIFETAAGLEKALPNCRERFAQGKMLTTIERRTSCVRDIFCSEFASDAARWMHKPLGMTLAVEVLANDQGIDQAAEWYWSVYGQVFPDSTDFLMLRNPLDILISGRRYWGRSYDDIAQELLLTYQTLIRSARRFYIIEFEQLVEEPDTVLIDLLHTCNLPFHEDCRNAFGVKHASKLGSYGEKIVETRSSLADFSYLESHDTLRDELGEAVVRQLFSSYELLLECHPRLLKREE